MRLPKRVELPVNRGYLPKILPKYRSAGS